MRNIPTAPAHIAEHSGEAGHVGSVVSESPQSSTTWSNCLTQRTPSPSAAHAASTAAISGRMAASWSQRCATSDPLRWAIADWQSRGHVGSAAEEDAAAGAAAPDTMAWQKSHA